MSRGFEATLREGLEHLFGESGWEAATVVLRVDMNAVPLGIRLHCHFGTRVSTLKSVLKQVHQRSPQRVEISGNGDAGVHLRHGKSASFRTGAETRCSLRRQRKRREEKRGRALRWWLGASSRAGSGSSRPDKAVRLRFTRPVVEPPIETAPDSDAVTDMPA